MIPKCDVSIILTVLHRYTSSLRNINVHVAHHIRINNLPDVGAQCVALTDVDP